MFDWFVAMGSSKKNRASRDNKKAAQQKQAKKAEHEKVDTPKSAKKVAIVEAKNQTGKKRPAPEPEGPPAPYQPETSELEKKRLHVAEELRKVEQQVRNIDTSAC